MSWDRPEAIHRTSLLYFGEEATSVEDAEAMLGRLVLQVDVGRGACRGRSASAAIGTVVNAGRRAFLGGVRVKIEEDVDLPHGWARGRSLVPFVRDLGGQVVETLDSAFPTVVLGDVSEPRGAVLLYPTWHGWSAGVVLEPGRRLDHHGIEIAAIAAGALGVSEAFQFVTRPPGPGLREVGISLWLPGSDWRSPNAAGAVLHALPSKLWLLGLGHLGQGYAWSIGWMGYADPEAVALFLVDDDVVEDGNRATGMLLRESDDGEMKTRVVARELEGLGIQTRIVERRFDEHFIVQEGEPIIALVGFDGPGPRRLLGGRFSRVVDGGLGIGRAEYLSVSIHTFPSTLDPEKVFRQHGPAPGELTQGQEAVVERLVGQGIPAASARCGVTTVAGIAVAAAFVGTFAGTLVVADLLRLLNGGTAIGSIRCDLRSPNDMRAADNEAPGPVFNPGFVPPGEPSEADRF
jgi:hypothetical protein